MSKSGSSKPFATSYSQTPYSTLIFDIGDVLFKWSPKTKTSIPPKTIKQIVSTPVWNDLERGQITQAECYAAVSEQFNLDVNELAQAFDQARETLQSDLALVSFIKEMKSTYNLKVYAMSNMSKPDYEYLRKKDVGWEVFDSVFTSCEVGIRKPDLGFYHNVLRRTGAEARRTVFVDDKLDNVLSARSLGMNGVVYQSTQQVMQTLRNLVCDPVTRGRAFLERNAGQLDSATNTGIMIRDNFAQMLILELTGDRSLINVPDSPKFFNFFRGAAQLTTDYYPPDLDTTSVGWTTLKKNNDHGVDAVMNEILSYCNSDGITEVYFDRTRPRIDPVVCVNTLTLFHSYGRGAELEKTMDWVFSVLQNRAYLDGTRYYNTAEAFLYFFARLISLSDALFDRYAPTLRERLLERIGSPGDSLELAMRVLACASVGVRAEIDLQRLILRQSTDGSWEDGWFYRYGQTGITIGNKGVTTAFAIKAIQATHVEALRDEPAHLTAQAVLHTPIYT